MMTTEFEEKRGERRSFYCSNKLWNAMLEATSDCMSVSEFVKQAVREKLKQRDKFDFRNI